GVIILVTIRSWVLARPVGHFKSQLRPYVFQNAAVWRQTEGSNQLTVDPLGAGKPIDDAVHCVKVHRPCASNRKKRKREPRWIVDSELLCRQNGNPWKAADVKFIVGWTRIREISISD